MKNITLAIAAALVLSSATAYAQTTGWPQAAASPTAAGTPDPVTTGYQLYQQANYAGAVALFQQAVQDKPNDALAKVWLGLAQVAAGEVKAGIFTLKFATDSIGAWSAQAAELRALAYWQQGEIDPAKSELGFCMDGPTASLCTKMKQGIDAGQQPPDVSTWPSIVGLTAAAQARGTTWSP